jgi:hypothetical protein
MPRRCRVLLVQPTERRARLRSLLWSCGYEATSSEGDDLPLQLFATGACAMLLDPSMTSRPEDAARLARIAGVPVVSLGGAMPGGISGVDQRLPAAADDVTVVAAVEVACFGHDHEHEEHEEAAPATRALARTGTDR